MITALYILGGWFTLCMIAAPILIPKLAERFARHDDWIKEPSGSHHLSSGFAEATPDRSVTPQVRVVRQ